ncbi:MAG: CpaF family protein, partial [Pseudomonadota bacterium]|nr:CpaF family protein [Pseudomonadota bacterium]
MSFGKRSATATQPAPAARPAAPAAPRPAAPAKPVKPAPPSAAKKPPRPGGQKPGTGGKPVALKPPPDMKPEKVHKVDSRSEEYYATKTTIFNALIDTIDLGQLAQLDAESAREEIRDIVVEIISIKNVVMSISDQEQLLDDICNDVLGYGTLDQF